MDDETRLADWYKNKSLIYSVTQTEQECKPLFHYLMFSMRHVESTPLTGIKFTYLDYICASEKFKLGIKQWELIDCN